MTRPSQAAGSYVAGLYKTYRAFSFSTALMCLAAPPASLAEPTKMPTPTLCKSDERSLFTCGVGKKVLSVCATRDLSMSQGSVYYRFGRLAKPELVYPTTPKHPSKAFRAYFNHWAKGNEVQLSFERGRETYTVYAYTSAFAGEAYGVGVFEGDRLLATHECSRGSVEHALHELNAFGLAEAQRRDLP